MWQLMSRSKRGTSARPDPAKLTHQFVINNRASKRFVLLCRRHSRSKQPSADVLFSLVASSGLIVIIDKVRIAVVPLYLLMHQGGGVFTQHRIE
jgi:hypothetical protein